jgi:hypothetical protein
MEQWLTASPLPAMGLWFLMYISDYYLTLYIARGISEIGHIHYQGSLELTPQYQNDIDSRKKISSRHISLLIAYTLLIGLLWWVFVKWFGNVWFYSFYIGMFLLLEVAVHVRHFRNIHMIRTVKKEGGIEGDLRYSRHYMYKASAFDLYLMAAIFAIAFAVTFSPFFGGGAAMCFGTGLKHNRLAGKFRIGDKP